jgi:hypothetical protein
MYLTTRVEALAAERDPSIAVPELKALLDGATQDISHAGQRVFHHPEAQGHASLDELARIFFSTPFADEAPLDVRLLHHALAPQLLRAYAQSSAIASKTWAGVLTGLREFRLGCACCQGVMAAVVGDRLGDGWTDGLSFSFTQGRFEQLWPGVRPLGQTTTYDPDSGRAISQWSASRAMVEQAAQKKIPAAEISATPAQAVATGKRVETSTDDEMGRWDTSPS